MLKYLLATSLIVSCASNQSKKESGASQPVPTPSKQPESPQEKPPQVPSPSPLPSIPGGDVAEVQQFMIFHNLKRCWHDAPRVRWSTELAKKAKADAETCLLGVTNPYDSIAYGQDLDIVKAQDDWYMQFLYYPYGKDEYTKETRDFAHIVWQTTTDIGCAKVQCASKNVIYCKYSPQANGPATGQVKMIQSDFMKCNGTN